ncbi:N-acetylmuramoyl-L-alanine amidase [Mesobacillus foraminis]|uniref:N-acetylmuramoyl-L-alanine amidase n=1 Tax=Mesobacillus foraminis TaxID=279826 RepID=UPI000EF4AC8C|nr:N-acetylmuramoyl-L-alanine amidase [Mesobacillus foraminis]
MKIMLDAGHGYSTPGKRSPDGMREYEFTRSVANHARSLLNNYRDVTVYFAHSDQEDVPLQERTNKANSLKVDAYVSIHANAFGGGGWTSAKGIETFVYLTRPRGSNQLAQKIQRNLIVSTGLEDRGVKTADFHVLRETNMDAVLIEAGFMTNREEIKLLRSDAYRKAVAEAIVNALADQYNLNRKPSKPAQPVKPAPSPTRTSPSLKGFYKVQAGAFKNRKNADELAESLQKDGYSPYVYKQDGFYKVQAGAFKDKENAEELAEKLRRDKLNPFIYFE